MNATPQMLELMKGNEEDNADANYIATIKSLRDHWEQEAITAQTACRNLQRQNKILQLQIEELQRKLAEPTLDLTEERTH